MGRNFFENHTQETPEQFRRLGQFQAEAGAGSGESKKEEIYFIVNTTIHIRLGVYSTELFQDILQMWICIEKKRPMLLFSIKSN